MDQTKTQDFDTTKIVTPFRDVLDRHGLNTSKLDDTEWKNLITEVQPLFSGGSYGARDAEGGGSYDR